jgi:hypothetical protein
MSKPIHVQIIKAAHVLVGDEKKWCRSEMALDKYGASVCATDDKASKWCAYGALVVAAYQMTEDTSRAFDLADPAASLFGGCDALMRVNDTKGRATVVALFDEVIKRFP